LSTLTNIVFSAEKRGEKREKGRRKGRFHDGECLKKIETLTLGLQIM
jgi:hypothetical protein